MNSESFRELNGNDNVFITNHKQVYDALKDQGVIYENKKIHTMVNEYASKNRWIFIHDLRKPIELMRVKKKNLSKLVWRSWGSDIGYIIKENDKFHIRLAKRILTRFIRFRVRKIRLIGIANAVDIISLKETFGRIPHTMKMPYSDPTMDRFKIVEQIKETDLFHGHGEFCVMVEHSGQDRTQIDIMNKLKKYQKEHIHLYLVLSYGKADYIETVKKYAESEWGNKATVIIKFMDFESYANLLSKMDAAIFDQTNSYALGNIAILTFYKKKLFLNRKGVIKKAFDLERIPYICTDEIEKMSFDEFIKPLTYPEDAGETIIPKGCSGVEMWNNVFKFLDQKENERVQNE